MNFNNDEEALDFFNRLLDRLRQAGYDQHGSHFQLVSLNPVYNLAIMVKYL